MGQKKLRISSIDASFDSRNGSIVLTSKDRKFRGKPFQLKISSDSSSYRTLMELMEEEGIANFEELDVPRRAAWESFEDFEVPGKNPKRSFAVGLLSDEEKLEFDLASAPHTLISGGVGGGKSVLGRNILSYALGRSDISLYAIDPKRVELGPLVMPLMREKDRVALSLGEAAGLLEELERKLEERYSLLESEGINDWRELNLSVIYLYIGSSELLFPQSSKPEAYSSKELKLKSKIVESVAKVARMGRAAGVYLFLESSPNTGHIPGELKSNLGRRIAMGNLDSNSSIMVLGQTMRFGAAFLKMGRGVERTYANEQRLFQSYYASPEHMSEEILKYRAHSSC